MEFSFENHFYFHNESPKFWEEGSMADNNGALTVRKGTLCISSTSGSSDNILDSKNASVDLLEDDPSLCEHSDVAGDIIAGNSRFGGENSGQFRASKRNSRRTAARTGKGEVPHSLEHTPSKSQGVIPTGSDLLTGRTNGGESVQKRSWLEDIQFTASYQHFRSIDYVSVVKSLGSLERVGIDQEVVNRSTTVTATTISGTKSTSAPRRDHSEPARGGSRGDSSTEPVENSSLCWNFPRVKLRRLFNAKSLDDILGRSGRKATISSETEPGNPHSAHSGSALVSESSPSINDSSSPLSKDPSRISVQPAKGPKSKGGLTGSSSESNCYNQIKVVSEFPDQTPVVTQPGRKSNLKDVPSSKGGQSKARGGVNRTVTCAKSDNCLHRIVSSTCTKFGANSVDNLDSETIDLEEEHVATPVPVPGTGSAIVQNKSKPERRYAKKTQVSPESISSPSVGEKVNQAPDSETGVATASGVQTPGDDTMPKEQPKLVVANFTYLQRPLSPTPASIFPTASSSIYSLPPSSAQILNQSSNYAWRDNTNVFKNESSSPRFTSPTSPPEKSGYNYFYQGPANVHRSDAMPCQSSQRWTGSGGSGSDAHWSRNRNDNVTSPPGGKELHDAMRLWAKGEQGQTQLRNYANSYHGDYQLPPPLSDRTRVGPSPTNVGLSSLARISVPGGRYSPFPPLEPVVTSQLPMRASPRIEQQDAAGYYDQYKRPSW